MKLKKVQPAGVDVMPSTVTATHLGCSTGLLLVETAKSITNSKALKMTVNCTNGSFVLLHNACFSLRDVQQGLWLIGL